MRFSIVAVFVVVVFASAMGKPQLSDEPPLGELTNGHLLVITGTVTDTVDTVAQAIPEITGNTFDTVQDGWNSVAHGLDDLVQVGTETVEGIYGPTSNLVQDTVNLVPELTGTVTDGLNNIVAELTLNGEN